MGQVALTDGGRAFALANQDHSIVAKVALEGKQTGWPEHFVEAGINAMNAKAENVEGWDVYGFTFSGEAHETFERVVEHLTGWIVRVTPVIGEPFDAQIHGVPKEAEMVNTVRLVRWSEDTGAHGDPFDIEIRNLHVY